MGPGARKVRGNRVQPRLASGLPACLSLSRNFTVIQHISNGCGEMQIGFYTTAGLKITMEVPALLLGEFLGLSGRGERCCAAIVAPRYDSSDLTATTIQLVKHRHLVDLASSK